MIPSNATLPLSVIVNNEVASSQSSDPAPRCLPSATAGSLWFEFTPAADGSYEFSIPGSPVPRTLSLWSGPACGPYVPVANGCGSGLSVQFSGITGRTVRLQVSTYLSSLLVARSFTLTISKADSSGSVPVITSVSAMSGPAAGGTPLIIGGRNLKEGLTVSFGGVPATAVTLMDYRLWATTPAHVAGNVDITITTADGKIATLAGAFTYVGEVPPRLENSA